MKARILLVVILISLTILGLKYFRKETIKTKTTSYGFQVCATSGYILSIPKDNNKPIAPKLKNLGGQTFDITTNNQEAQLYFNQGLNLLYGFNFAEAHRSFLEASRLDPSSAMTFWGQAYALGPNINDPSINSERKKLANDAIKKAIRLSKSASEKEQKLIKALSFRYSRFNRDRGKLNDAYMKEMEKLSLEYPIDANIVTFYTASVLNTRPWNYWDKSGIAFPNVNKAIKLLTSSIASNQFHVGLHHYYIHIMEAAKPKIALGSARILDSMKLSSGHLMHMPSHIYMPLGRYRDVIRVNLEAIKSDEEYLSQCYSQGIYPLSYYPHNMHFLWYASSMLGLSEVSIDFARKMKEKVPYYELSDSPILQTFSSTPILSYIRFGKWTETLTIAEPGAEFELMQMYWHYARGIAFLRINNLVKAQNELAKINVQSEFKFLNFSSIAHEILSGEIELYKENYEIALEHLKKAVVLEDNLHHMEPPPWYIPTRQTLGASMLKAQKYNEAEEVFLQDLEIYPNNGWSLKGLYLSLKGQNKQIEADSVHAKFVDVWKTADLEINNSVL